MKTILAVLTLAFLTTGALAWGAHNPSAVDHPDVPNCTLFGTVTYETDPTCETIIPQGGDSIYVKSAPLVPDVP